MADTAKFYTAPEGPSVQPEEELPRRARMDISVSPEMFGASIGRGLEQLGQGATKASDFFSQISADQATNGFIHDKTNILYGTGQTREDGSVDTGFMGLRGQAAIDAAPGVRQALQDAYERHGSSVPGAARVEYDKWSRREMDHAASVIGWHGEQQHEQWAGEVSQSTTYEASNAIAKNPLDDDAFKLNQTSMVKAAIKEAQVKYGIDADNPTPDGLRITSEAASKARAIAAAQRIEAVKDSNPAQAVKWLDQYKADLSSPMSRDGLGRTPYERLSDELKKVSDAQETDASVKAKYAEVNGLPAPQGAPGATGRGLNNGIYQGALNAAGVSGASPASHYSYLKSIGATDNEALMLTGAAASESSFNAKAVHDNGNGYGMYGHNLHRLDLLGMPWEQQAAAALDELRRRPEDAQLRGAKTLDDVAVAQMHYERPAGYSTANPKAGDNYTGRLNTLKRFASLTTSPLAAIPGGTSSQQAGTPQRPQFNQAGQFEGATVQQASFQPGQTPVPTPPGQPEGPQPSSLDVGPKTAAPAAVPFISPPPPSQWDMIRDRTSAAMLSTINDDSIPSDKKDKMLAQMERDMRYATFAAEQDKATRQRHSEEAVDNALDQTMKGDYAGAYSALGDAFQKRTIDAETYQRATGLIEKRSGQLDPASYGPRYHDALDGILKTPGAPGRVNSLSDLLNMEDAGDISALGYQKLKGAFEDANSPEKRGFIVKTNDAFKRAEKFLKWEIQGPTAGTSIPNPRGDALIQDFDSKFYGDLALYKGDMEKFPYFDSEKLGKILSDMYPEREKEMNMAGMSAPSKEDASWTQLPAPVETSAPAWYGTVANPPTMPQGRPMPNGEWDARLRLLIQNPNDATKQFFDARYGPKGIVATGPDADSLLQWLKPSPQRGTEQGGRGPESPRAPVTFERLWEQRPGALPPTEPLEPMQLPGAVEPAPAGTVIQNEGTWNNPQAPQ